MEKLHRQFLNLLNSSIHGTEPQISEPVDWQELYNLSVNHMIAPVLYESAYRCENFNNADEELKQKWRKQTIATCMFQLRNNAELAKIYSALEQNNVHPLLVKGLVCRSLYKNPDIRISSDEDMLVRETEWDVCEKTLSDLGLVSDENEGQVVTWSKPGTQVHLEVHRTLFPENSAAYGHLNEAFKDVFNNAVNDKFCGINVYTLSPTEHFLYLLCHSIKHFLGSGFGIRQLCDISLFSEKYSDEIDWDEIWAWTSKWGYEVLTLNLLDIGIKYLTLPKEKVKVNFKTKGLVDSEPLLLDLFDSGIYGKSTQSRLHSSRITLNAVEGHSQNKSVLKTLFPPKEALIKDYPELEKSSSKLPLVWAKRITKYAKESRNSNDNSAIESVKLGNRRVELFKKYRVLK